MNNKRRGLILLSTIVFVGFVGYLFTLYARGYRFNPDNLELNPSGLVVLKSDPDGAQVFVGGELLTATNSNASLPPDIYDVEVKKDGYHTWSKRIEVFKEVVTEVNAFLFKNAPSLTSLTFTSSVNPLPSNDFTKIIYQVPATSENLKDDKEGLWVIETINLPVGFARDPRRITNGDLEGSTTKWSPNGREVLLSTPKGDFLLDMGTFTSVDERVNITSQIEDLLLEWEEEKEIRLNAHIRGLPDELEELLLNRSSAVVFSPDEKMILYTASSSATLPNEIIKPMPGASTQKQERNTIVGHTYVYDIKEDRNFLVDDNAENLTITSETGESITRRLAWFSTSRHLVLAEGEKITIMDIDGTNRQEVYKGSYVAPHAFPIVSNDRLIILTNLGSSSSLPNLYSLGVR